MRARLRHRPGRGVLGRLRHRLGRRPLLHRLRAAAQGLHDDPLRGQAGGHARPRRVLAGRAPSTASTRCSPRRPPSARSRRRTRTASTSARYDLSRFRTLFLAGERCDPDTLLWARERLGVPVIDHWWQTETGWPIAANCVGHGHAAGEAGLADQGRCRATTCACSTRTGRRCPPGQIGASSIRLPLPPGCLPTLWNNDEGFEQAT